jgi:hypothetical protein
MNGDDKALELTAALVTTEKELCECFRQHPQLDDTDRAVMRRDTYLAVIRLWMKKKASPVSPPSLV